MRVTVSLTKVGVSPFHHCECLGAQPKTYSGAWLPDGEPSDRRPPRTTTVFRVAPQAVGALSVVSANPVSSLAQRFVIR